MEEQLISYKTAVLTKEKGFTEYCNNWYENTVETGNTKQIIGRTTIEYDRSEIEECSVQYPGEEGISDYFNCQATPYEFGYYLRPTQSLLAKWLRETHKIHCEAQFRFELLSLIKFESVIMIDYKVIQDASYEIESMFNTYEEALEDALLNALSKIE